MDSSSPAITKTTPARERILLTAHELFYQHGIRATGIDKVISESHVTKVTFYRHFPSKNHLIRAFLDYRHQRWINWFESALARHGGKLDALAPVLGEWFTEENFRGCAFINSLSELGGALPDIAAITRSHKEDMTAVIEGLLPQAGGRKQVAEAIALIVDGAIVHAQYDPNPAEIPQVVKKALMAIAAEYD